MTLKIEITIPQERIEAREGSAYLADAMAAIGFSRGVSLPMPAPVPTADLVKAIVAAGPIITQPSDQALAEAIANGVAAAKEVGPDEAGQRERGKPSPGRARRTKEEIAEDEAAEAAAFASEAKALAAEGAAQFAADRANIPTCEERHDPTTPAEDAQDAADEAADDANASGAEVTREDVRLAMVAFQNDFGVADLVAVLTKAFAEVYPGAGVKNLKMAPEGAEGFAQVIARIDAARAEKGAK